MNLALRDALRRHAYAATALPLGLTALVAAPLGCGATVGRWQRSLAARLIGADIGSSPCRVWTHALVGLPVNLLAFALVVPIWAVFITRGVLYPVFAADNLEASWGGPTLPGAWFAHFIQGPPLLFLVTVLLRPLSRLQVRLAERYLNR